MTTNVMKTIFIFNFALIVVLSVNSDVNLRKFQKNNQRNWDEETNVVQLFNDSSLGAYSKVSQKPNSSQLFRLKEGIPETYLNLELERLKFAIEMDVPLKEDLPIYMESLKRIIRTVKTINSITDSNMKLGLFLTQVNLEWSLRHGVNMGKELKESLTNLSKKNRMKLILLHNKILKYNDEIDLKNKIISSLFKNSSVWVHRIRSFNSASWDPYYYIQPFKKYDWDQYETDIEELQKWRPTPQNSDECLESLTRVSSRRNRCINTLKECDFMVINGNDIGYALAHRLLYLLVARYTLGCDALPFKNFSPAMFCEKMYAESLFIASNQYKNIDLIMEHSALCSLEGYAEFLRRSFLTKVLQYQTPLGCFSTHPYEDDDVYRKTKRNKGICEVHVTSVAAGTISAAIRFIVQTYYT